MPLQFEPQYYKAIDPLIGAISAAPKPAIHDIETRRAGFAGLHGGLIGQVPDCPDVEHSEHSIKSHDGETIVIHHYYKKGTDAQRGPAI